VSSTCCTTATDAAVCERLPGVYHGMHWPAQLLSSSGCWHRLGVQAPKGSFEASQGTTIWWYMHSMGCAVWAIAFDSLQLA
jgi:hypothetical protein